MLRTLRFVALTAVGTAGTADALAGQVLGLPVRNAGVATGLEVGADLGFPSTAAGKGWTLGASGALGLGPFGVTASVARHDPRSADAITSVGGSVNLKIFGGPLIPLSVTLQAGLARATQDVPGPTGGGELTITHVPVGVGFALVIPNPAFSIKPWIAPRLDVTRESGAVPSDTDTNFGVSAGIDLGFLGGLGFRAMYDRVQEGGGVTPSVLSLGLSYGFKVGL